MHLLYRIPYNEPNNKYYKEFDEKNLVDWFENLWTVYSDVEGEFYENIIKEIGVNLYGFWGITGKIVQEGNDFTSKYRKTPPKNQSEIIEYLKNCYHETIGFVGENALQVLTDDDELQLSYYIFSDDFAKKNPKKCAYLTYPKWELPEKFAAKSGFKEEIDILVKNRSKRGKKATYIVINSLWDGGNLSTDTLKYNVVKIEGLRLNTV